MTKKIFKLIGYLILTLVILVLGVIAWGYESDISFDDMKAKYANEASKFVKIDGVNVHYRDEGRLTDSVALVLIHGTASSLHTWDGWVAALKNDFRIVRLDLPAYGLTGPNATHDYSSAVYVSVVKQLLDHLHIKKCYIAGNSLGGEVAWNFALAQPTMTKKLILVDAAGYLLPNSTKEIPIGFRLARMPVVNKLVSIVTPRNMVESSIKNVYFDDTKVTDEVIDRYWQMTLRVGNRAAFLARMNNFNSQNDAWKQISNINAPTLIQWGKHDLLITTAAAERFHKDLPNDTLIVYANAGHVPMEEIPAETARDVMAFLKKK
jgi:pimeloyl-ACP methyl ester carboxylesterase